MLDFLQDFSTFSSHIFGGFWFGRWCQSDPLMGPNPSTFPPSERCVPIQMFKQNEGALLAERISNKNIVGYPSLWISLWDLMSEWSVLAEASHWSIKCWFFSSFVTKRWVIDDDGAAWESWWVNGRLKVIEGVMQAHTHFLAGGEIEININ